MTGCNRLISAPFNDPGHKSFLLALAENWAPAPMGPYKPPVLFLYLQDLAHQYVYCCSPLLNILVPPGSHWINVLQGSQEVRHTRPYRWPPTGVDA